MSFWLLVFLVDLTLASSKVIKGMSSLTVDAAVILWHLFSLYQFLVLAAVEFSSPSTRC